MMYLDSGFTLNPAQDKIITEDEYIVSIWKIMRLDHYLMLAVHLNSKKP